MSASPTPILVVLAAGMGSRFGGDKQLAVLGSTGRTLLHFSVQDAYAAGVRSIVLIVRQNIIAALEQQVLPHFPADLTVQLVLQNPADVPVEAADLGNRQKPWGTAHALWSARQFLQQQPCIVINADDYYGQTAMQLLVKHFATTRSEWAMVAFPLLKTLSAHGGVNRGICQVNADYLQAVTEVLQIKQHEQQFSGIDVKGESIQLDATQAVSMNIWGFTPSIVPALEKALCRFFALKPDGKAECYLPAVVDSSLQQQPKLRVYMSPDSWFGVTYPADLAEIVEYFQQQVSSQQISSQQ